MKIETLLLSAFIILILIGLSYPIFNFNNYKLQKTISKIAAKLSMVIMFLLIVNNKPPRYDKYSYEKFYKENNLPQIDSSMYLESHDNISTLFNSSSKDSIRHVSKNIQNDIFNINSVDDYFENTKEVKTLHYHFINHNIFHHSSLIIKLNNTIITKEDADKILKSWGLFNIAFK